MFRYVLPFALFLLNIELVTAQSQPTLVPIKPDVTEQFSRAFGADQNVKELLIEGHFFRVPDKSQELIAFKAVVKRDGRTAITLVDPKQEVLPDSEFILPCADSKSVAQRNILAELCWPTISWLIPLSSLTSNPHLRAITISQVDADGKGTRYAIEPIKKREPYVLSEKVRLPEQTTVDVSLDTGLPVSLRYEIPSNRNGTRARVVEITYEDYGPEQNGVVLAHQITRSVNGVATNHFVIEKVTIR